MNYGYYENICRLLKEINLLLLSRIIIRIVQSPGSGNIAFAGDIMPKKINLNGSL